MLELVDVLINSAVIHDLRDDAFGICGEHIADSVLKRGLCLLLSLLGEVLLDILAHLRERIELGDILRKLVIDLRQLLHGEAQQLDLEDRSLACEALIAVVLREGDIHIELLADIVTDNALLEARDELTGAEAQRISLALAAFKRFIVDEALEVDRCLIAHLSSSALDIDDTRLTLTEHLDLTVHILVGDLMHDHRCMDALVLGNGDLRLGEEHSLADSALSLGAGDQLHRRAVDDGQAEIGDDGIELAGDQGVHGVLKEDLLAVESLDDLARDLALAEALDGDILLLAVIDALAGSLEILCGDREGDLPHIYICFGFRDQAHIQFLQI